MREGDRREQEWRRKESARTPGYGFDVCNYEAAVGMVSFYESYYFVSFTK